MSPPGSGHLLPTVYMKTTALTDETMEAVVFMGCENYAEVSEESSLSAGT